MKRGGRLKRSWIKRGKKQLERKTRLKARGKSMFPGQRQPEFMAWMYWKMKAGPRPCDGCKRWRWTVRAHLDPKGRGAPDEWNVCLLCPSCHSASEKRVDAWIAETGIDLWAKAASWTRDFPGLLLTPDPSLPAPPTQVAPR